MGAFVVSGTFMKSGTNMGKSTIKHTGSFLTSEKLDIGSYQVAFLYVCLKKLLQVSVTFQQHFMIVINLFQAIISCQ